MPFVEFVAFLVFENPEVVVAAVWLRFFSGGLSSLSTVSPQYPRLTIPHSRVSPAQGRDRSALGYAMHPSCRRRSILDVYRIECFIIQLCRPELSYIDS